MSPGERSSSSRAALFMDRDGTVIDDVGYPSQPQQVRLLPGVATALRQAADLGFALVLVSNQSGIGRGLVTPKQAQAVHLQVMADLDAAGVHLDGAFYCQHAPGDGCRCRKPAPGLLLKASRRLGLDLSRSFMVGDRASDLEAGRRAGCRTIAFGFAPASGSPAPGRADDWAHVVALLAERPCEEARR